MVNFDTDRHTRDGKQDIELGRAWSDGMVHWDRDMKCGYDLHDLMMGGMESGYTF